MMPRSPIASSVIASLSLVLFAGGCAQQAGDAVSLRREIAEIKAFDAHAHPMRVVIEGEPPDEDWDALTWEAPGPDSSPPPVGLRSDNPRYIAAWKALYGYRHDDMSQAHVAELLASKQRLIREKGDAYPAWVLDRLGIETMSANRVAMGRGLDGPRFRWVSYVDALTVPLSNERARRINAEYRSFYAGMERRLKQYLGEAGFDALPATLDEYVDKVVVGALTRQKTNGAVAVKFETSYLRSLDVAEAMRDAAAAVYSRYVAGGEPPPSDYKILQDYLFRTIALEAGRRSMAVHIHVGGGAGAYYSVRGSNPDLLEPVLNDPSLHDTRFLLIHGGWPFERETALLIGKSNVYADFSAMTFLLSARTLSSVLRTWLELNPEHVLFGTDGFSVAPQLGWEEVTWLANQTGREALAMALDEMVMDGSVTRGRALELARMVLRENALRLYSPREKPVPQEER